MVRTHSDYIKRKKQINQMELHYILLLGFSVYSIKSYLPWNNDNVYQIFERHDQL